jgi:hypothetical protein
MRAICKDMYPYPYIELIPALTLAQIGGFQLMSIYNLVYLRAFQKTAGNRYYKNNLLASNKMEIIVYEKNDNARNAGRRQVDLK